MAELRLRKSKDEIAVLAELIALGDELLPAERRFVDDVAALEEITQAESRGIANLLARYAAKPKGRG